MGETTAIAWAHATFNAWWGCSRVSPACEHCYAETLSKSPRHRLDVWGVDAQRKPMSENYWKQPVRWNRKASIAGERVRVFCSSMADVFEIVPERNVQAGAVQAEARGRLWKIIEETPWLDWLLLTKRPENVLRLVPESWAKGFPSNVWLGATVDDQERAEKRLLWLLESPAQLHFVSCEPLLGPVDLTNIEFDFLKRDPHPYDPVVRLDALRGHVRGPDDMLGAKVSWVIVGGESGGDRRPFDHAWAASLQKQCREAGAAFFMKQDSAFRSGVRGTIPNDLWVQEVPISPAARPHASELQMRFA